MREIVVDNFAGGGGASTGIEIAIGRSVDIAINHDPAAISMHKVNHPATEHFCEDVWEVDPVKACKGRPVALAWFSPDCKHHSKAKGGKPVDNHIRGLAWVAIRWAYTVRPRCLMLENVEEFRDWGPLNDDSRPIKERAGETFDGFVRALSSGIPEDHPAFQEMCDALSIKPDSVMATVLQDGLGYQVEHRLLRACDYGAPTSRIRFFMIARCDKQPIVWPEPTHADPDSDEVKRGVKLPWEPVSHVLDFSIPCPSIFASSDEIKEAYGIRAVRPLKENTMRRIAKGVIKFVLNNPEPFVVDTLNGCIAPSLIQYHSEQTEDVRGQSVERTIMTVDASNRYGLVSAFLKPKENDPVPFEETDRKAVVHAFLTKYYGTGDNQASGCDTPAPTITTKDRLGLVMVKSIEHEIVDIGLRMLTPRELFDAQGFPSDYVIDVDADGKTYPRAAQVARCGNAVCPPIPTALIKANLPELCVKECVA